jgi:FKBP-type peptidyl-prolyl cis-trans isomerase FkpA
MNRFAFLSFTIFCFCLFAACGKDAISVQDQAALDKKLILEYLKTNNVVAQETPEGVFYEITKVGGGINPMQSSTVEVTYVGYFLDGKPFDGTSASTPTVSFPLNNVIEGWQIALPLLKVGGSGTFWIPSALAYGRQPPRGIPSNAVLIFDIGLVNVK